LLFHTPRPRKQEHAVEAAGHPPRLPNSPPPRRSSRSSRGFAPSQQRTATRSHETKQSLRSYRSFSTQKSSTKWRQSAGGPCVSLRTRTSRTSSSLTVSQVYTKRQVAR